MQPSLVLPPPSERRTPAYVAFEPHGAPIQRDLIALHIAEAFGKGRLLLPEPVRTMKAAHITFLNASLIFQQF